MTTGDAASGKSNAEDTRPVVASVGFVDLGRPSKFGRHHNQGTVKQAALIQVGDQGGERLVQFRTLFLESRLDVGVMVPATISKGNETHARFHKAPGEQHTLTCGIAAILVAQLGVFLVDVESLSRFLRAYERVSILIKLVHRIECIGLFHAAKMVVYCVQHASALEKAIFGDAVGQGEITN